MIDKYPTRKTDIENCRFLSDADLFAGLVSDAFRDFGYETCTSYFSHDLIKRIRNISETTIPLGRDVYINLESKHSTAIRSVLAVHNIDEIKEIVCQLTQVAETILQDRVYIHQSRINYKRGNMSGWHFHSDFETWHSQDGMPEMRAVTFVIPLTENKENNGPLIFYPGSHRIYYSAAKDKSGCSADEHFSDQKAGVIPNWVLWWSEAIYGKPFEVVADPGDLITFHCNLIHGSEPNHSISPRINLYLVFNSVNNALVHPFSYEQSRPEAMACRRVA